MSASSVRLDRPSGIPETLQPQLVRRDAPEPLIALRTAFWIVGILLASAQAWLSRYMVSADSVSYLDMSDFAFPGWSWQRLINPVWSPLYPFFVGLFRRGLHVPARNEIIAGHVLNIVFFLFAFICFEFFLRTVVNRLFAADRDERPGTLLPRWAYLSIGYVLFLWASIFGISLQYMRPDMLMSGFVYLTAAMLVRMHGAPARWKDYALLGALLGVAFLSKAIFLPLGVVVLAASLLVIESWRPALKMAPAALAILLAVGSLYFVPLSIEKGRFSLGETGAFNYVLHVNQAGPLWYLQTPGTAKGVFAHSPQRIFSSPATYAFPWKTVVTHPLRFDPSYWIEGVRPRFTMKSEIAAMIPNLRTFTLLNAQLASVVLISIALGIFAWHERRFAGLRRTWPLLIVGLTGCLLYLPIHVESRYVAEFIAIFWFGVVAGLGGSTIIKRNAVLVCTGAAIVAILLPLGVNAVKTRDAVTSTNQDAEAAAALQRLGIQPGSPVARLSDNVTDLGIERLARVEIVAEIDKRQVPEFLSSPPAAQDSVLTMLGSRGIKAVIATVTDPNHSNLAEWKRLGSTNYWVWLPADSLRASSVSQ